jgi:FkbM family methyltransferase
VLTLFFKKFVAWALGAASPPPLVAEPPGAITADPPEAITAEPPEVITADPPEAITAEPLEAIMAEPPEAIIAEPPADSPEIVTLRSMSTDRALWRVAARGLDIGAVVDVGASNGMWSAVCEKHFPASYYLLIEAHKPHEEALKAFCGARSNAQYVLAAAGDECGEIYFYFDDTDLFRGAAAKVPLEGACKIVRQTTIDHEIGARGLPGPYLIKLDTQGYELPILRGAKETLRKANLVVIETYNFRICDGSLLFHEMVAYMRELGFGVIDMSEPLWRREFDLAFWQIDLFFVPLDRPEFQTNTYR